MDLWSTFMEGITCTKSIIPQSDTWITAQTDEEAPGELDLPRDEEGYPLLPDDAMDRPLEGKKALIRKYMADVRSQ